MWSPEAPSHYDYGEGGTVDSHGREKNQIYVSTSKNKTISTETIRNVKIIVLNHITHINAPKKSFYKWMRTKSNNKCVPINISRRENEILYFLYLTAHHLCWYNSPIGEILYCS